MAGYNAGRTLSLQTGSTEAGHRWLADHPAADPAFVAGYEWSLFDYEDQNGLPHAVDVRVGRQSARDAG